MLRYLTAFLLVLGSVTAQAEPELKTYTLAAPKSRLTVVHAGATWCGPCMKMHPQWDEFAARYRGKVTVVHVNVDQQNTPEYKKYGSKIAAAGGLPLTLWLASDGSVLRSDQRTLTAGELSQLTEKERKKSK